MLLGTVDFQSFPVEAWFSAESIWLRQHEIRTCAARKYAQHPMVGIGVPGMIF
jgi:hypothetical protein